jgi:hypothetical protein
MAGKMVPFCTVKWYLAKCSKKLVYIKIKLTYLDDGA